MAHTLTGTLRGNVITLDDGPKSGEIESEGAARKVRVVVEPLSDLELEVSPQRQAELLRAWAEHGPQGPIDDVEVG